ncbi:MAG: magnesium transporter, partial [Lachnospiraceae bacterium]|nr:magnesium transporter [Lachnospiraceae bacterium]
MSEELELMETEVAKRPDYEGEIMAIVRSQTSPKVMQEKLGDYHENDIAEVLPKLSSSERVKLYRVLGTEVLSAVFEYTEDEDT